MDTIRRILTCPISHSIINTPVHTPCSHLFDLESIVHWLLYNGTCPVCRRALNHADLTYNPVVTIIRDALNFTDNTSYASSSTQTEQHEELPHEQNYQSLLTFPSVPDTIDTPSLMGDDDFDFSPGIIHLNKPFVMCSDHDAGVADLTESEIDYLGVDKLVDLGENLFNPNSANRHIEPVVDRLNQRFLLLHDVPRKQHVYAVIRKYVYQHTDPSPLVIARHLMLQGYYIYDVFRLRQTNGLYTYCIYSLDILANRLPNHLNRFTRLSHRLP